MEELDSCLSGVEYFTQILLPQAQQSSNWSAESLRKAMKWAQNVEKFSSLIMEGNKISASGSLTDIQDLNIDSWRECPGKEVLFNGSYSKEMNHLCEILFPFQLSLSDLNSASLLLMKSLLQNQKLSKPTLEFVKLLIKENFTKDQQAQLSAHETQCCSANLQLQSISSQADQEILNSVGKQSLIHSLRYNTASHNLDSWLSKQFKRRKKPLHGSSSLMKPRFLHNLISALIELHPDDGVVVEVLAWLSEVHADSDHVCHQLLLREWLLLPLATNTSEKTCFCPIVASVLVSLLRAFYNMTDALKNSTSNKLLDDLSDAQTTDNVESSPFIKTSTLRDFLKYLKKCQSNLASHVSSHQEMNVSQWDNKLQHSHNVVQAVLSQAFVTFSCSQSAALWLRVFQHSGVSH